MYFVNTNMAFSMANEDVISSSPFTNYITTHLSDHDVFHGPKSLPPNRTHFQSLNELAVPRRSGLHTSGGGYGDSSKTN